MSQSDLRWLSLLVAVARSGPCASGGLSSLLLFWSVSFPLSVFPFRARFQEPILFNFGRGRHVLAPGWEGRRVKRKGTDPRTAFSVRFPFGIFVEYLFSFNNFVFYLYRASDVVPSEGICSCRR